MGPLVRTGRFVFGLAVIVAVFASALVRPSGELARPADGPAAIEAPSHDHGPIPPLGVFVAESEEEQEDEKVRQRLQLAGSPAHPSPFVARPSGSAPRATELPARSTRDRCHSNPRAPPLG